MNTVQISPVFHKEMEQIRGMNPRFFNNDSLGRLPPLTRLLFIGLWCKADKDGRLEDRPRAIKKAIMGYDDVTAGQVNSMLQVLHDSGLIARYQAEEGGYIQVVNFSK